MTNPEQQKPKIIQEIELSALQRFLQSLDKSGLTTKQKLSLLLFLVSVSFATIPAESAAAHSQKFQGTEQADGSEPTIITNTDQENEGRIIGKNLEVQFAAPAEGGDQRFPVIRVDPADEILLDLPIPFLNPLDAFNNLRNAAGYETPALLKIAAAAYRRWIEKSPDFVSFLKQTNFTVENATISLKYVALQESMDDGVLQEATFSFVVWYDFTQGQSIHRVDSRVSVTVVPQGEEAYVIQSYGVETTFPELKFEPQVQGAVVLPEQKGPDIAVVTSKDLKFFGPSISQQLGEFLDGQVFVNMSSQTAGLPPFADGLYPAAHPNLTDAQVDQVFALETTSETKDIRFGTVVVSEDGSSLGVTDAMGGKLLFTLALPDRHSIAVHSGITPTVTAANQDGTLLAIKGLDLRKPFSSTTTAEQSTIPRVPEKAAENSVILIRWQAMAGMTKFAKNAGIKAETLTASAELFETLEGASIESTLLFPGEKIVAHNNLLVGVSVTPEGVTVRQLGVEAGAEVWNLKNTASGKKEVSGILPTQEFSQTFSLDEFRAIGLKIEDVAELTVKSLTVRQPTTEEGLPSDLLIAIELVGKTTNGDNIQGSFKVVASTGISDKSSEIADDKTPQGFYYGATFPTLKIAE